MNRLRALATAITVAVLVSITCGQFALTVAGQRGYLTDLVHYSPRLAWTGSYVIEGTMGMAMLSLLLTAWTEWTAERIGMWSILVAASAASVLGNVMAAATHHLSLAAVLTRGSWPLWALAGEWLAVRVIHRLWTIVHQSTPDTHVELADPFDIDYDQDDTRPAPAILSYSIPRLRAVAALPTPRPARAAPATKERTDRGALSAAIAAELDAGRWPTRASGLEQIATTHGVSVKTATRERNDQHTRRQTATTHTEASTEETQ